MLELSASIPGLELMIAAAGRSGDIARTSAKSALRKLRTHVLTVSKREVARELGVPQKALRTRYISDPPGPNGLRVWVGTNPLPVSVLGKPRQLKAGAKAGRKKFYSRAFVATMASGHRSIFMRRTSSAYDPAQYHSTRYDPVKPWSRLPIAEAFGPLPEVQVERSILDNEREFEEFFRRNFFNEFNWRMQRGR